MVASADNVASELLKVTFCDAGNKLLSVPLKSSDGSTQVSLATTTSTVCTKSLPGPNFKSVPPIKVNETAV